MIELFDLWYADRVQGIAPSIREFENYIAILLGYYPEACNMRGICSVQNVVEADGSVYPCDFYMMDEYRLGNFNQDRLDRILERAKESGFVERSLKLTEECRACEYFKICRGGCQRNREFNPADGMYRNYYCESFRRFFEKCLPRLKKLAETIRNEKSSHANIR